MKARPSFPFQIILACLLASLAFVLAAPLGQVRAEPDLSLESFLAIAPIDTVPIGQRPVIRASLTNASGKGVPNKVLIISLDNERMRRIRTDANGNVEVVLGKDLPAKRYSVQVTFEGTEAYLPSSAQSVLTVRPARLEIETIPPLAGIVFRLEGRTYETGQDGLALVEIFEAGEYSLEAIPPAETAEYAVRFDRWGDEAFSAARQIEVAGDRRYQAGFALFHSVSQDFIDLDGEAVDDQRIDTLTLKSSFGARYSFEDGQPRMLQANRIARRKTGLEATPVQYAVESVIIDGANVVNQAQQRFHATPGAEWQIELLLYYARIRAYNSLLGMSVGSGVALEYPDGQVESLAFDQDGSLVAGPLARGIYRLQVMGASGIAPWTPVALSQDQVVNLKVLTALDLALGIFVGFALALGLLLFGRPQLVLTPLRMASGFFQARRKPSSPGGDEGAVQVGD